MRILVTMLKQRAVYWAASTLDRFGNPTFSDPVEIKCRWIDVEEVFINNEGEEQVSKSKVYTDRDVTPKGYLKLGLLSDLDSDVDPVTTVGAWEIASFGKLPTLRADKYLRTAML